MHSYKIVLFDIEFLSFLFIDKKHFIVTTNVILSAYNIKKYLSSPSEFCTLFFYFYRNHFLEDKIIKE